MQHTRELVAEIVAAYREVREVDREAARVNASAPLNEDRRLRPVEQTARALSHLMGTCSILDEMKLVDFDTAEPIWPPPEANAAVAVSQFKPHFDARYLSGDWWQAIDERNRTAVEDSARVTASYVEQAKEREARANANGGG